MKSIAILKIITVPDLLFFDIESHKKFLKEN